MGLNVKRNIYSRFYVRRIVKIVILQVHTFVFFLSFFNAQCLTKNIKVSFFVEFYGSNRGFTIGYL